MFSARLPSVTPTPHSSAPSEKSAVNYPAFQTAFSRNGNRIVRGGRPRLNQVTLIRVHSCPSVVAPSRSGSETLRDAKASPAERRFDCDGAALEDRAELISRYLRCLLFQTGRREKAEGTGHGFRATSLASLELFRGQPGWPPKDARGTDTTWTTNPNESATTGRPSLAPFQPPPQLPRSRPCACS